MTPKHRGSYTSILRLKCLASACVSQETRWKPKTFCRKVLSRYSGILKIIEAKGLLKDGSGNHKDISLEQNEPINDEEENAIDMLSAKELLGLIHELPDGYRMVFNLNVIEGYTHKEIGDMLNISENTSKSQLSRARGVLQNKLKKKVKGD